MRGYKSVSSAATSTHAAYPLTTSLFELMVPSTVQSVASSAREALQRQGNWLN